MKFILDTSRRFVLSSVRDGGWVLVVDDKMKRYCNTPADAVRYLADELTAESVSDDVSSITAALDDISKRVAVANNVIDLIGMAEMVADVIAAVDFSDSKRDQIRDASLASAKCSEAEFKTKPVPEQTKILLYAKTVLTPFWSKNVKK